MSNDSTERLNTPEGMDRFTATGRPFKEPSRREKAATTFDLVMASDSVLSTAGVNHLPVKFTDKSVISIPVLPKGGAQIETPKKKRFWSRRKSENNNFVMKEMTRGEYLKNYAKDDQGKYTGTEDPAEDCILRGEDIEKYRPVTTFRNDIEAAGDAEGDGVIR
jgi:hypothetical protein